MTADVVHLGPLLQYEYYAEDDERRRQYAHPAHETMWLSTAETDAATGHRQQKTGKNENNEICMAEKS